MKLRLSASSNRPAKSIFMCSGDFGPQRRSDAGGKILLRADLSIVRGEIFRRRQIDRAADMEAVAIREDGASCRAPKGDVGFRGAVVGRKRRKANRETRRSDRHSDEGLTLDATMLLLWSAIIELQPFGFG